MGLFKVNVEFTMNWSPEVKVWTDSVKPLHTTTEQHPVGTQANGMAAPGHWL